MPILAEDAPQVLLIYSPRNACYVDIVAYREIQDPMELTWVFHMSEYAAPLRLRRLFSVIITRPVVPLVSISRRPSALFSASASSPASLFVASVIGVANNDLEGPWGVLLVDRLLISLVSMAFMASTTRSVVVTMAAIVIRVVSPTFMVATGGNRITNVLNRPLIVTLVLVPLLRRRAARLERRPLNAMSHDATASLHEYARLVILCLIRDSPSFFKVIKIIEVLGVKLAEGSVRKRSAVLFVLG